MNNTYPYPYSAAEARKRNELSLWRESHKANIACRNAIRALKLSKNSNSSPTHKGVDVAMSLIVSKILIDLQFV